jgi:uncharacterized protein
MLIDDPWFYLAAVPAVLIFAVSKGGFGGGVGILAVPMLSLVVPPAQAAAILLPLLCFMDLIGVAHYRRHWNRHAMSVMLPGTIAGIVLGSLAFGYLDDDLVRLILGVIATAFALHAFRPGAGLAPAREPSTLRGAFWGAVSGFTSTLAHAGGPPANMYLLPLKLNKTIFVGTMIVLFTAVNAIKLIPYSLLGLFEARNLLTAVALAPLAAFGMRFGIWLHSRVREALFYRLCYFFVLLTGLKLVHDGLT